MKKALITGVTGQDGTYLTELLVSKGYQVIGLDIRLTPEKRSFFERFHSEFKLLEVDINDSAQLREILHRYEPEEIYNLASLSFVPASWESINLNIDVNARAVASLLEIIKTDHPAIRLYQASSSEMFGEPDTRPQTVDTPLSPQNPYAAAKAFAHWLVRCYRQMYGLYAVSGILYNHESPRRPEEFVTRKITSYAARIKLGFAQKLPLGNLEARRDWGFAGDYVRAMWMMLQQDAPLDFVIGTGKLHSVRDACQIAFTHLGLDYRDHVVTDERYYRQAEHYTLVADIREAQEKLGWEPATDLETMIQMMVDHDLELLKASPNN
jgi:GDPmannose 4,6-dehydratase